MRILPIETNYNAHRQYQLNCNAIPSKLTKTTSTGSTPAKITLWAALATFFSNLFKGSKAGDNEGPKEINTKSLNEPINDLQAEPKEINAKPFDEQINDLIEEFKNEYPEYKEALGEDKFRYLNFLRNEINELPSKEDLKRFAELINNDAETLNKTLDSLKENNCLGKDKKTQCNLPGLLRCAEFMKNNQTQTYRLLKYLVPEYAQGEKASFETLDSFFGFIAGLIIALDAKANSYYYSKEEQQEAYNHLAQIVDGCTSQPTEHVHDLKLLKSESCAFYSTYMNELLEYKDIKELIAKDKNLIFKLIENDKIFDKDGINLIDKFSNDYFQEYLWRTFG